MNETRVKRLVAEGQVELTMKMFKRLTKHGFSVSRLVDQLAKSELKDEDVFAYPDFTFQMGLPQKERDGDLVCVQTADGRTVRIVGYFDKRIKVKKHEDEEESED